MKTPTRPEAEAPQYCSVCGTRYWPGDASGTPVEIRDSPVSLQRKFCHFVHSLFGGRLWPRPYGGQGLAFDRKYLFGSCMALILRNPESGGPCFPTGEWPDLELVVRDPAVFDGCVDLARLYQAQTGKRAAVVQEF